MKDAILGDRIPVSELQSHGPQALTIRNSGRRQTIFLLPSPHSLCRAIPPNSIGRPRLIVGSIQHCLNGTIIPNGKVQNQEITGLSRGINHGLDTSQIKLGIILLTVFLIQANAPGSVSRFARGCVRSPQSAPPLPSALRPPPRQSQHAVSQYRPRSAPHVQRRVPPPGW